MQSLEPDANYLSEEEPEQPLRIWIESQEGDIARGLVEILSETGALVRLVGSVLPAPGQGVVVRLAVDRTSPTLGGTACVRRARPDGDGSECELEWTHSGPERERLARFVISRS